jgi:hypothetical protein
LHGLDPTYEIEVKRVNKKETMMLTVRDLV